jgi:uncharacterized protein (TIGR03437 family)
MIGRVFLLAAFALARCLAADTACVPNAPCYAAAGIVNVASGSPAALSPNTLASLYGTGLAYVQSAISAADISAGALPVVLPGTGVTVSVGGYPAHIYLVSPGQVNFLIPSHLAAAEVTLRLVRDGTAGPGVKIVLRQSSPALFQIDGESVVASHLDYSLVSREKPSRPGNWVVLWATGLGPVTPPATYGMIPLQAAQLERLDEFRVLLDGVAVAPQQIGYAGVAPGWAGLYQINLKLPPGVGRNPEIRISSGGETSPAGLRIWVDTLP